MSAVSTIIEDIKKIKNVWQKLLWEMANGDVKAYKELKSMDVFEFYPFLDNWKARQEHKRNQIKQKNNGRK